MLRHGSTRRALASSSLVALAIGSAALFGVASAEAASGDLDTGFASGGFFSYTPVPNAAGRIGLQADGKIVFAAAGTPGICQVRRLLADGTLDATFGTAGVQTINPPGSEDCRGVVVQPDGKLLVVGTTTSASVTSFFVARLLADGSPDPSWAGTGLATVLIGTGSYAFSYLFERGPDLALDPAGRVVIAGAVDGATALARFTATGGLDVGFGAGGTVLQDLVPSVEEDINEVLLQLDGKILVVGLATFARVARFHPNGGLDLGFGTGGVRSFPAMNFGSGLALQSDGKILVTGGSDGSDSQFVTTRLLADGSDDASFGTLGTVSTEILGNDIASDVLVQPDGKILVGGSGAGVLLPVHIVVRYTSAGAPDGTWGAGGEAIATRGGFQIGQSLALQPDGRVLLGGFSLTDPADGVLMRFEGDAGAPPLCGNGAPDPGEECDDGNTATGDCCSSDCTLDPAGTACGPTFECSSFVCDGAGACGQENVPDGMPCDDQSACTADACESGVCVGVSGPSAGCKVQTRARGLFQIKDEANDARDALNWRWLKGEATSPSEFVQQDYDLCVFDSSGGGTLVAKLATNGNLCSPFRCWKLKGTQPIYVDVFGSHDGLRQMFLKPDESTNARIKLQARGANLPLPTLPLTPPVVVQMHGENGECWEATYSSPKKNEPGLFQATPDP